MRRSKAAGTAPPSSGATFSVIATAECTLRVVQVFDACPQTALMRIGQPRLGSGQRFTKLWSPLWQPCPHGDAPRGQGRRPLVLAS